MGSGSSHLPRSLLRLRLHTQHTPGYISFCFTAQAWGTGGRSTCACGNDPGIVTACPCCDHAPCVCVNYARFCCCCCC